MSLSNDARGSKSSTARIWAWTPLTMAAFIGVSSLMQCLGIHPFLLLVSYVLIPLGMDIAGLLLPREFRWPIGMATTGISSGLVGGTLTTWACLVIYASDQQNKLELFIGLAFWGLATLSVGGSVITAMVLILIERWQHADRR